jgi:hypothetical protein
MDSLLSFPVGLFHPLQHAGLSRRTPRSRLPGNNPGFAKLGATFGVWSPINPVLYKYSNYFKSLAKSDGLARTN